MGSKEMKIISDTTTKRIAIQCEDTDEFSYLLSELADIQESCMEKE